MTCLNPQPHEPHQYLADADAVTLSPCPGRPVTRPTVEEWALGVAEAVSARGECTRRRVGAVILDAQNRICGAGYNGAAPGAESCLDGACPRGQHYEIVPFQHGGSDGCACGNAWPCPEAAPVGSSYDTGPGACISVHAELNALLDVSDRSRLEGGTLYVTTAPCEGCLKILKVTRIIMVVYENEEGGTSVESL